MQEHIRRVFERAKIHSERRVKTGDYHDIKDDLAIRRAQGGDVGRQMKLLEIVASAKIHYLTFKATVSVLSNPNYLREIINRRP
jgi:hypothetical protein